MSEPTHYLDIRIGIDYKELLSPERIDGVKVALGVKDSDMIIESHANLVLGEIKSVIQNRIELLGVQAQVIKIDDSTHSEDEPILEESKDHELDKSMIESIDRLEKLESLEQEQVEEEVADEDDSFQLLEMLDDISNSVFEIQSMLGTVNSIKIRSDKFTAAEIALNLGFDESQVETGVKELESPYTIKFTDAQQENNEIMGEK